MSTEREWADVMTPREIEEYRALRATIRERSTARLWIVLAGLTAWAALTLATAALAELPIATLLPLLVLALTFEIVFALHTGVERVGRYIQVFFEDAERRSRLGAPGHGVRPPRSRAAAPTRSSARRSGAPPC